MTTTGSDPADVGGQPRRVLQGPSTDRATLAAIARQAMIEHSLEPDFPPAALQELAAIGGPAGATDDVRDLRDRLWASIDNDDSRDLDQLTVAESLEGERIRILVAVADVDALVRKGSAIDGHASHNTTSVYTPAAIFPMLLEALSTDLTSLNEDQDRIAVVADMVFEADGSPDASRRGWMAKAQRPGESWRFRGSTRTSASRTASRSGSWTCGTDTARSASRRSRRRRFSTQRSFPISSWIERTGRRS